MYIKNKKILIILLPVLLFFGSINLVQLTNPAPFWGNVCGGSCIKEEQQVISQTFVAHRESTQKIFLGLSIGCLLLLIWFIFKKNKLNIIISAGLAILFFLYYYFDSVWLVEFGQSPSFVFSLSSSFFLFLFSYFLYKKIIQ
ncbi:MAG: hypothetical protein WC415_06165 [Patescibacteria group bacterium]|jgi:hypothetical protein